MPLNLAISGATGRMGRALARLIRESEDLRLVGGIARSSAEPHFAAELGYDQIEAPETARRILERADVLIDFSNTEQLERLIGRHADALAGRALVIGTTGLSHNLLERLDTLARRSAVLASPNFSPGVNALLLLAESAAALLPADRYDVEIVEAHHRKKADAPSDTALALGRAIAAARDRGLDALRRDGRSGHTGERPAEEIGFHALRGGDVVGEHRVLFLGARERIELAHAAADRALFAEGALLAARWVHGKPPGKYAMRDVLTG